MIEQMRLEQRDDAAAAGRAAFATVTAEARKVLRFMVQHNRSGTGPGHREEVDRHHGFDVIIKEGPPGLRRRFPRAYDVLAHVGLADIDAEFIGPTIRRRTLSHRKIIWRRGGGSNTMYPNPSRKLQVSRSL